MTAPAQPVNNQFAMIGAPSRSFRSFEHHSRLRVSHPLPFVTFRLHYTVLTSALQSPAPLFFISHPIGC